MGGVGERRGRSSVGVLQYGGRGGRGRGFFGERAAGVSVYGRDGRRQAFVENWNGVLTGTKTWHWGRGVRGGRPSRSTWRGKRRKGQIGSGYSFVTLNKIQWMPPICIASQSDWTKVLWCKVTHVCIK